jgi:hypothetical protein
MKVFGSISRLVSILFRKDSQDITVRPNQGTTYTAARDVQLPAGDAAHVLVSRDSTDTLTNKTIDGDSNTVQDLALSSLKTVLGDADEVVVRDAAGAVVSAKLVNANVDAAAAIAYSKLSIADGDLSIAKTSGLQSALDGKVDENAAITGATKTKITYDAKGLVTAGDDLAASDLPTGIDAAKIADGSVSNAEFQYISTLSSNAQDQIDGKQADVITTQGDLIVGNGSGDAARVAIGTNGYVLTSNGTTAAWAAPATSILSYKTDWVTGDTATKVITHSLNSLDIQVEIFDKTDGQTIHVDSVVRTDADTLTLSASEAPGAAGWRVVIHTA